MHDTIVKLKDGRTFCGPIWEFRPKEGWFTIITENDSGCPNPIYFKDCMSAVTPNERLTVSKVGDEDEMLRAIRDGWEWYVPLAKCEVRHVYRLKSRNLKIGVYDGERGLIGVRYKFDREFLFTEYHYDAGAPYGTVHPIEDIGVLPEDISCVESGPTIDAKTRRLVGFDRSSGTNSIGFRGWYFLDTNEASTEINPHSVENENLFKYLKGLEEPT